MVIDNTMATQILCQPGKYGADLIVYSTTKFLSGHGNAIGGAVVDMGNFEWDKGRDFLKLTKPDTSYHDINFYETFGKDAILASKVLGIVLTKRGAGSTSETELAGFPHHSIENYLPKLVKAGYRVAICDQLEDPKLTKKIVKRGVTEIVTPGIVINDGVLDQNKNNFLASIYFEKKMSKTYHK